MSVVPVEGKTGIPMGYSECTVNAEIDKTREEEDEGLLERTGPYELHGTKYISFPNPLNVFRATNHKKIRPIECHTVCRVVD